MKILRRIKEQEEERVERKKEKEERKEREKMREEREMRVLKKKIYVIQLQYHLTFEMVL